MAVSASPLQADHGVFGDCVSRELTLRNSGQSMTEEQLERWRKIWAADLLFERIATEDMEQTFQ